MVKEVQYERLRPALIRAAREACPALYIPIGTIEWHGHHNPVGLDTLKAHAIAIRCAQTGGGLVFPPLYYGESRDEVLIDSNPEFRDEVAKVMGWSAESLAPGHVRRSAAEQIDNYIKLLLHILNEGQSLGFRVMTFVCGHYPLIDLARAAAQIFHQQAWRNPLISDKAIPWAFCGYELVKDRWPDSGDHGHFWETSLMMAIAPDSVDLDPRRENLELGVGGPHKLLDANAEFGREALELIAERATAQVRDRLENRDDYLGHGLRL